jgi:alpha 1,2-mannosyltransferase
VPSQILWPDFWAPTQSPLLQTIQVPGYQERDQTTESGQIYISKSLHRSTLLLSLYYNYYGPGIYYSLFSQGAHGEGDKETFAPAADFFRLPYYMLKGTPGAIGNTVNNAKAFHPTGTVQNDPQVDYESGGELQKPLFVHQ